MISGFVINISLLIKMELITGFWLKMISCDKETFHGSQVVPCAAWLGSLYLTSSYTGEIHHVSLS